MAKPLEYNEAMGGAKEHIKLAEQRLEAARTNLEDAKARGITELGSFEKMITEAEQNLDNLRRQIDKQDEDPIQEAA